MGEWNDEEIDDTALMGRKQGWIFATFTALPSRPRLASDVREREPRNTKGHIRIIEREFCE